MINIEIYIVICYNIIKKPPGIKKRIMKTVILSLPMQPPFAIATNVDTLIDRLKIKYGSYVTLQNAATTSAICIEEANGAITFSAGGNTHTTSQPLWELDRYLFDHTAYDSRILALHGGAVEWKQHAYLFLAPTVP